MFPFSELTDLSVPRWSFYCTSLLIIYEAERYVPVNVDDTIGYQVRLSCLSFDFLLTPFYRIDQVRDQSPHFLEHCINEYENSQCTSTSNKRHSPLPNHPDHHQLNPYEYIPVRTEDRIDVKMIDHAHTLPTTATTTCSTPGIDESYLYALKSLISHLEGICDDVRNGRLVQISPDLVPPLLKGTKGAQNSQETTLSNPGESTQL